MNQTFEVSKELNLDLSIQDKVYIRTSNQPYLSISNSNNYTEVKAHKEGNTISITQTFKSTPYGESIITNGNRTIKQEVIGNNNFTIGNLSGGIINMGTVKGDMIGISIEDPLSEIDLEDSNKDPESIKNVLIIYVPNSVIPNVEVKLSAIGKLITSFIQLGHVDVKAKGTSFTNILCESLKLKAKDNSTIKATIVNGEVNLDCKGSSQTTVRGCFADVSLKAKGATKVNLIGECKRDYSSSASGIAEVHYYGTVEGKVTQSTSGLAKNNLSN